MAARRRKRNSNPNPKYYAMRRHLLVLVKDCQRRRVFSQRDECRSALRDSRYRRGKRRRSGGVDGDLVFRQSHFRRKRPSRRLEHQFHFPNRVNNTLFVQTAELCSRQIASVLPKISRILTINNIILSRLRRLNIPHMINLHVRLES